MTEQELRDKCFYFLKDTLYPAVDSEISKFLKSCGVDHYLEAKGRAAIAVILSSRLISISAIHMNPEETMGAAEVVLGLVKDDVESVLAATEERAKEMGDSEV